MVGRGRRDEEWAFEVWNGDGCCVVFWFGCLSASLIFLVGFLRYLFLELVSFSWKLLEISISSHILYDSKGYWCIYTSFVICSLLLYVIIDSFSFTLCTIRIILMNSGVWICRICCNEI